MNWIGPVPLLMTFVGESYSLLRQLLCLLCLRYRILFQGSIPANHSSTLKRTQSFPNFIHF